MQARLCGKRGAIRLAMAVAISQLLISRSDCWNPLLRDPLTLAQTVESFESGLRGECVYIYIYIYIYVYTHD